MRGVPLIAAVCAGGLSLAATTWAASARIADARIPGSIGNPLVPLPLGLLPPGARPQPDRPPLTASQQRMLAAALWRSPLDQELVNAVYIDTVQSGQSSASISRATRTLAATGWRYTPAQQNLLARAALDGRFSDAVDRAEGLLRRQRLTAVAIAMMSAMEAAPETRPLIVGKLQQNPGWRGAYLGAIKPEASSDILSARVATTAALLRTPAGVTRYELAGLLTALTANGRSREAYGLWQQQAGSNRSGNLVYDGNFTTAMRNLGKSDIQYPFEWTFGQDIGYSTQLSPGNGVAISWDGRGAPVFLTQRVPVRPGQAYMLQIQGRVEAGSTLAAPLAPLLTCGDVAIVFDPVSSNPSAARFAVPALPAKCDMATLSIGGNVDNGAANNSIIIKQVVLLPAR